MSTLILCRQSNKIKNIIFCKILNFLCELYKESQGTLDFYKEKCQFQSIELKKKNIHTSMFVFVVITKVKTMLAC